MLHPAGYGAARPSGAVHHRRRQPQGHRRRRAARRAFRGTDADSGFAWSIALTFGTVLAEARRRTAHALAAAGHAAPMLFHFALENDRLELLPNGDAWAAAYADVPPKARHLALHDRHLIALNERDRPFVTGELLTMNGFALTSAGWRERIDMLASMGATEIAYQPAGPDIPGELERIARAVRSRRSSRRPVKTRQALLRKQPLRGVGGGEDARRALSSTAGLEAEGGRRSPSRSSPRAGRFADGLTAI